MTNPEGMNSNPKPFSKTARNASRVYIILGFCLMLVISGVAGFYIGKYRSPMNAPQIVASETPQPQMPRLPEGVTRLPSRTFGNWNLNCLQNRQQQKICELVLRAVDKTRKALVLSLAVARNPKGGPVFVVTTPPSAELSAGIRLVADTNPEQHTNFVTCGPRACHAVSELTDSIITMLSSGTSLQVSYVAERGRAISYKLPIAGFHEGYAAWQAN